MLKALLTIDAPLHPNMWMGLNSSTTHFGKTFHYGPLLLFHSRNAIFETGKDLSQKTSI